MSKNLLIKKCVPCEGGVEPMGREEAEEYLKETPGWTLNEGLISRQFKFQDFKQAMEFVGKVAELAESEGHHPDIHISYNIVRLESYTHAIGGLSENDFILAAKINELK